MSMREPSVDKLLEKIDSKYKIAYIAAKRARQISNEGMSQMDHVETLPEAVSEKSVGLALEEILNDVVSYELEEN
ncbi:MAG: DNA-directed RNA polymerase subunit omega [Defluviitaleaceae bacterium]|nr:DNA-directed RNA polymerase subunit omega [Defluviitaleaceae bacterium]